MEAQNILTPEKGVYTAPLIYYSKSVKYVKIKILVIIKFASLNIFMWEC